MKKHFFTINWKYAIGEIIIVIIGITIAFALNRWAANRQDQILADQYLENLKLDIENDANTLQENMDKIKNSIANHRFIMNFLNENNGPRDSIAQVFFAELSKDYDFFLNLLTFEALKYYCNLKLIKDFQLRNDIVKHYEQYALLERAKSKFDNINSEYTARIFMEEVDFKNMYAKGDFSFFDHPVVQNVIYSNAGVFYQMHNDHEAALNRCRILIERLEEALMPLQTSDKAKQQQ